MASTDVPDTVVASRPGPGLGQPHQLSFSPCRNYLTFLQPFDAGDLLARQLSVIRLSDVASLRGANPGVLAFRRLWDPSLGRGLLETEANLSLDEKLRRERARQMNVGVTSYAWPGVPSRVLIPLGGNVFCKDVDDSFGDPSVARVLFDKSSGGLPGDSPHGGALDATLSPDGKTLGFVRDAELYVANAEPANPAVAQQPAAARRLTWDARGKGLTNGLADYLAQEEMDRYKGFWFSPDSQWIAFEQVDEGHIPEYRIMHQGSDSVGEGAQEDHRYPFAGRANPRVRVGVVPVAAEQQQQEPQVQWLDFSGLELRSGAVLDTADLYLGRVDWLPDGSLAVQLMNREQSELLLVRFAGMQGAHGVARQVLLREHSDVWINLHDLFVSFSSRHGEELLGLAPPSASPPVPPAASGAAAVGASPSSSGASAGAGAGAGAAAAAAPLGFFFLWGSERSGFMHLYLYHLSTGSGRLQQVRQLTAGEWMVNSLVQVTVPLGLLFFVATKDSPLERHVYVCRLWPAAGPPPVGDSEIVRVTSEPGTNALVIDAECTMAVLSHSSLSRAPRTELCTLHFEAPAPGAQLGRVSLKPLLTVHAGEASSLVREQLTELRDALRAPEIVSFPTSDAKAQLYGCLYRPDPSRHGHGPYPLVVAVYGGPHVQRVQDAWATTCDMRAQRLAQGGYLVLKVDNRGSSARGLHFEGAIKHVMGTVEVSDQVDGVRWLAARGLADPRRVGIYGWSYGGYLSIMCLLKRPDVFHVAVSGAPVTHWDGYDTCYTERYMGTPESNPKGYHDGSAMAHVASMAPDAKLMLVHGLIDENVHFRHTARLINALIAARKRYDLLLFPDERHAPRKQGDRVYMEQCIRGYFDEHLYGS